MKTKDGHFFVNTILKAAIKEIPIVSLILFVPILISVSIFLNIIDFLDQRSGWKLIIICVFSALYVLFIIILMCARICERKFSTARDRIEIWLKEKRKYLSFDALRKDLNEPSYTEPFLKKLIKKYPKVFRNSSPIKTSQGLKPGIALVMKHTS